MRSSDPAFDVGVGDLTVHEVEVPRGDPHEGGPAPDDDRLASSPGTRVGSGSSTSPTRPTPTEVGHDIDPAGNNLWGVALAKDQSGDHIVLASDRDSGLFMFRYTGPLP